MYVKIGPYHDWIGPYQIAEKLLFWMDKDKDDRVHNFGTWLANDKNGDDSHLTKFCNWVHSFKKVKRKIRIDAYDTWGMDSTLSHIILPMLQQLQATKHGSQMVDDADVPDALKSTSAPPKENEWDIDDNLHRRWDWVMKEMIWAFTQIADDDSDDRFHNLQPLFPESGGFDVEGYKAHNERIQRGTVLFGKYYRGLWD